MANAKSKSKSSNKSNIAAEESALKSSIPAPTALVGMGGVERAPVVVPTMLAPEPTVEEFDHSPKGEPVEESSEETRDSEPPVAGAFNAKAFAPLGYTPGMSAHEYARSRPSTKLPTPWRRASTMILNIPSSKFAELGMASGSPAHQLYRAETGNYVKLLNGKDPSTGATTGTPRETTTRLPFGERKTKMLDGLVSDISELSKKLCEAFDSDRASAQIDALITAAGALKSASESFKLFPADFAWEAPKSESEEKVTREFKPGDVCTIPEKYRAELGELTGCENNELAGEFTVVKVVAAMKSAVITGNGVKIPVALRYLK